MAADIEALGNEVKERSEPRLRAISIFGKSNKTLLVEAKEKLARRKAEYDVRVGPWNQAMERLKRSGGTPSEAPQPEKVPDGAVPR